MDAVHHPDDRPWIGPPLVLGSYFDAFQESLRGPLGVAGGEKPRGRGDLRQSDPERTLRTLMGATGDDLSNDVLGELDQLCHVSNLTIPDELPRQTLDIPTSSESCRFRPIPIPRVGVPHLQTLSSQQSYLQLPSRATEKSKRQKLLKHANNHWFESAPAAPEKVNPLLKGREIVATVRVYWPVQSSGSAQVPHNFRSYSQEFLVLGRNKLVDLRDLIKCPVDYYVSGDVSDNPDKKTTSKRNKEEYRSGFFYIDGCFYNDMRWPDCIDYSSTIRKWAEDGNRKIGPFTTQKMEDVEFKDLRLRLGCPYVYVHQGNHEHVICFTDARLMSVDDPQKPSMYPIERSIGVKHSKYCMTCSTSTAKWITQDNERVPEDPFYFCDACFRSFNYDNNGLKIGKFKAFPYVDVNAI